MVTLYQKKSKMSNFIIHKANSRGTADHGWLKTAHSFSFSGYYNPERMHFGVLRVLNDDYVEGGKGFGTHPHDNMEIITIPFEGALEHKDSMGNSSVIQTGDIQVMSAGTGITHSEFNHHKDQAVKLFQIWLFPDKKDVTPRYQQISLDVKDRSNRLQQVLSPNPDDQGVWIHQNAWFFMGNFDKDHQETYELKAKTNGVYILVISGSAEINGQMLDKRDAIGIWDAASVDIKATSDAEILIMDIPMN
jgi:redox-sensitive bicupin YhaK (pirin superfamily)